MLNPSSLLLSFMALSPDLAQAQDGILINPIPTFDPKASNSFKCQDWTSSLSRASQNLKPVSPKIESLIPTELNISPPQNFQGHRFSPKVLAFYSENRDSLGKFFRLAPHYTREAQVGVLDSHAIRNYIRDVLKTASRTLLPSEQGVLEAEIAKDSELLGMAKEYRNSTRSQKRSPVGLEDIELGNLGLDRYFVFIPETGSELVPAQILDLRWTPDRTGFYLIVESIRDSGVVTSASDSHSSFRGPHKIRQIQLLSEKELLSVPQMGLDGKRKIEQSFLRDLAPEFIEAKSLAEKKKLKSFSFSHFSPTPVLRSFPSEMKSTTSREESEGSGTLGTSGSSGRHDDSLEMEFPHPLLEMNDHLRFAIEHNFVRRFGDLKGLWNSD
ncbi:MAG: hypothetical protein WCH11_07675, partial [Bdellovibrio sp.]